MRIERIAGARDRPGYGILARREAILPGETPPPAKRGDYSMTSAPDRLLAAYLNALYEFDVDGDTHRLRAGDAGTKGVAWLDDAAGEWFFVTAHNPGSAVLCESENEARHEDLGRRLRAAGWRHLPARGLDPEGAWPPEPGFLVLDPPLAEIARLARELEQSALLHGAGGAPRVMVLEVAWREAVARADGPVFMAPVRNGPVLEAHGLGFFRGPDAVFADLDFRVAPGRILLAEGANGSGKTTLVRLLAGLLEFHAGSLTWNGEPVTPGSERLRGDMLYLGHRLAVKDELSALENLQFLCGLHGQPRGDDACERALADLGLAGLQDTAAGRLSAGQRKRVALARLVLERRPLWLLDEPYANLDREGAARVSELIAAHAGRGGLTVLTAHEGLTPDLPHLERLPLGASHARAGGARD